MARPPRKFGEFIGQRRSIRLVQRLIKGARVRGLPCPSLLFVGPSGVGKSTLAKASAAEYGSKLYRLFAGAEVRSIDVCEILFNIKYGDFLFVDEAHSLKRDAQQVLYAALDEWKVPAIDEGRLDRSRLESIACFTLLLATNAPGGLQPALRNRLDRVELDPYTEVELIEIAKRVATLEQIEITPQGARRLAEVAQGSPRLIQRRLENLRLLWPHESRLTEEHVRGLLKREGVDDHGLVPLQRRFLRTLARSHRGACSLRRLAVELGYDVLGLQEDIEPFLIGRGLIEVIGGLGRKLTVAGRAAVKAIPHASAEVDEAEEAISP
jgi:Holliday junction DNA helicase RuvB